METCPLCCNDMDATDLAFKPCTVRLSSMRVVLASNHGNWFGETVGKCPACRQDYDQDLLEFDAEQVASLTDESSAHSTKGGKRGAIILPLLRRFHLCNNNNNNNNTVVDHTISKPSNNRYAENYDGASEGDKNIAPWGGWERQGRGRGGRRGGVLFGGEDEAEVEKRW